MVGVLIHHLWWVSLWLHEQVHRLVPSHDWPRGDSVDGTSVQLQHRGAGAIPSSETSQPMYNTRC